MNSLLRMALVAAASLSAAVQANASDVERFTRADEERFAVGMAEDAMTRDDWEIIFVGKVTSRKKILGREFDGTVSPAEFVEVDVVGLLKGKALGKVGLLNARSCAGLEPAPAVGNDVYFIAGPMAGAPYLRAWMIVDGSLRSELLAAFARIGRPPKAP